jgi:uncharacterized membrane protein
MTMPVQRPLQLAVVYGTTLCVFLAIDALWLAVLMKPVYAAALGPLLAESPRWVPAALFYLLYVAGCWCLPFAGPARAALAYGSGIGRAAGADCLWYL